MKEDELFAASVHRFVGSCHVAGGESSHVVVSWSHVSCDDENGAFVNEVALFCVFDHAIFTCWSPSS